MLVHLMTSDTMLRTKLIPSPGDEPGHKAQEDLRIGEGFGTYPSRDAIVTSSGNSESTK